MNIEMLKDFLLWCTVVNYAVLLVWFFALLAARDWIYGLHARMFGLLPERIAVIHYKAIAVYKLGILLFNLVPLIALHLIT